METEPNLAEITIENVAMTVTLATAAEATNGRILLAKAIAVVELAVVVTRHILSNGQVPTKEKAALHNRGIRLHASQTKSLTLALQWNLTLVMVDVRGGEEIAVVVAIVETLLEGHKCQISGHATIMVVAIGSTTINGLEVATGAMTEVERQVATAVSVINAGVRSVANTAITMVASSVNQSRMWEMGVAENEREIGEQKLFSILSVVLV